MGKYIIAPTEYKNYCSRILKSCIEYIGGYQRGHGSNYSKGKRYLKQKTGCSGASLKTLYMSYEKYLGNAFLETNGPYIFKYDKTNCAETLKEIITFLDNNLDDDNKRRIFSEENDQQPYIDILYKKQTSSLLWVIEYDFLNEGEIAQRIYDAINRLADPVLEMEVLVFP